MTNLLVPNIWILVRVIFVTHAVPDQTVLIDIWKKKIEKKIKLINIDCGHFPRHMADIDTFFKTFNILKCFQVLSTDFHVGFHGDCGNVRTTVSNFIELLAVFATGKIIATS